MGTVLFPSSEMSRSVGDTTLELKPMMNKILIINPFGIGGVFFTTPFGNHKMGACSKVFNSKALK